MPEHLGALLGLVLAAYRHPLRYQERLKGPLPVPFQPVLRLAAGKALPELEALCQQWQATSEELRQAAVFFIEQACLEGIEDPYRILGLEPGADPRQIQTHYHLLMLLFHPDRAEATANWRDAYAARINWAYQQLRSAAGRQRYLQKSKAIPVQKGPSVPIIAQGRRRLPKQSLFSYLVQRFPRLSRYLPHLILGSGAAITGGLVLSLYFSWAGIDIVAPPAVTGASDQVPHAELPLHPAEVNQGTPFFPAEPGTKDQPAAPKSTQDPKN